MWKRRSTRKFAQSVEIHGARHLVPDEDSSFLRRTVWIVLLVLCVIAAIVCICFAIHKYCKGEVLTVSQLSEFAGTPLPSLTVCSSIEAKLANYSFQDLILLARTHFGFGNVSEYYRYCYISQRVWYQYAGDCRTIGSTGSQAEATRIMSTNQVSRQGFDYPNFLLRAGRTLDDLVLNCTILSDGTSCQHLFSKVLLFPHGNCFTFNPDGDLSVESLGNQIRLTVSFGRPIDDYDLLRQPQPAIYLQLHAPMESPDLLSRPFLMINSSEQRGPDLRIKSVKRVDRNDGVEVCKERNKWELCMKECIANNMLDGVGCTVYGFPGQPQCDLTLYTHKIVSGILEESGRMCRKNIAQSCGTPCVSWEYMYDVEYASQDTNYEVNITLSADTLNQYDTHLVRAYPILALLADIGGYLALFLGASILTIVHVLEFSLLQCSYCCCATSNTKKMVSPEPNGYHYPPATLTRGNTIMSHGTNGSPEAWVETNKNSLGRNGNGPPQDLVVEEDDDDNVSYTTSSPQPPRENSPSTVSY